MRPPLGGLDGRHFDVVVVGAGAIGASAAQHSQARGYNVLLVDKGDFGSGTSSRSSRLLACGVQYLVPEPAFAGEPTWRSVLSRPAEMLKSVAAARQTMRCRTQIVLESPGRTRPVTFFHPIYENGPHAGWQVDLGFRLLERFGSRQVPLDYTRLNAEEARHRYPMIRRLGRQDQLRSVAIYQEYQYDWAERICVDAALEAQRIGATVRNYTTVCGIERKAGRWEVWLEDKVNQGGRAQVNADILINAAGPWIDRVNSLTGQSPARHVAGIKGVNVLFKLPNDCEGFGVECFNSTGQHFFAMPWGRHHFFGPTVTPFEGDPDDVRVNEDDLEYVVKEANYIFPTAQLTRDSVVYAWAGVRPRTHYEGVEVKRRSSVIHDLEKDGMPNAFALTECPIMLHRHAGATLAANVARRIKPSRNPVSLSFSPTRFPDPMNSPILSTTYPDVRISDLRHAVMHEHAISLADLLFRRVKIGWDKGMGFEAAKDAARAVADLLGWDEDRIETEVQAYQKYVQENFRKSQNKGVI